MTKVRVGTFVFIIERVIVLNIPVELNFDIDTEYVPEC